MACTHQLGFGSAYIFLVPVSRLGLRRKSCPPGLLCRGHFFHFPVHCRMTRRDAGTVNSIRHKEEVSRGLGDMK